MSWKLLDWELQEGVGGNTDTTRDTALGKEPRVDPVMAFIGLREPSEIPVVPEPHGLMDQFEGLEIYDRLEAANDPKRAL